MKRFEYKFFPRAGMRKLSELSAHAGLPDCMTAVFNKAGAAGWELVQITSAGAWFKREGLFVCSGCLQTR